MICSVELSIIPLLLFLDHCQNLHPVYAFDIELKRLKRDFFFSLCFFYLEVSRMGPLSFDRARSPGKFGTSTVTAELSRFVLAFLKIHFKEVY